MTISFFKPTVTVEGNTLRVLSRFSSNEDVTFTTLAVFYRLASSSSPGDNKTFGNHSGTAVVAGGGIVTGAFEDLSPMIPDGVYDVWTSRRVNGSSVYLQTDKVRVSVGVSAIPPNLDVTVTSQDTSVLVEWQTSNPSAFLNYQARITAPAAAIQETGVLSADTRSVTFSGLENYVDHSIEVDGNLA